MAASTGAPGVAECHGQRRGGPQLHDAQDAARGLEAHELVAGSAPQEEAGGRVGAERVAVSEVAAGQVPLGIAVVRPGDHQGRVDRVGPPPVVLVIGPPRLVLESCEDACEVHDVLVVICLNANPVNVRLPRAILVQPPQSDGEELHDLAGEVLIWVIVRPVKRLVSPESQIVAHDRAVRDLTEHVAEVAKRMPDEDVIVIQVRLGPSPVGAVGGNNEYLGQRPRNALAKLVIRLQGQVEPNSAWTAPKVRGPVQNAVVAIDHLIDNGSVIRLGDLEQEPVSELRVVRDLAGGAADLVVELIRLGGKLLRQRERAQGRRELGEKHHFVRLAEELPVLAVAVRLPAIHLVPPRELQHEGAVNGPLLNRGWATWVSSDPLGKVENAKLVTVDMLPEAPVAAIDDGAGRDVAARDLDVAQGPALFRKGLGDARGVLRGDGRSGACHRRVTQLPPRDVPAWAAARPKAGDCVHVPPADGIESCPR
mmetsp:Transcript_72939/g.211135  ORF Transcript_72939/g.211135 Transcript_72939/m.211135 type:complete len:481 (+) Transcript_72939:3470-4912(+)